MGKLSPLPTPAQILSHANSAKAGDTALSLCNAMHRLLKINYHDLDAKVLVAKALRSFKIWKYPAILLFGLFGTVPALQPGVSGFKGSSDFIFGGRRTQRIELENIKDTRKIKPDWCMYDEMTGMDGDFLSSMCGAILNGKKSLYSLEPINNRWNRSNTIYQYGTQGSLNLAFEGVDLERDWEWLKFFYGYDVVSNVGGIAIRLQPLVVNSYFIAFCLLFLFSVLDLLFALVFAVRKLFRGNSPKQ